jgi:hypothetical protein
MNNFIPHLSLAYMRIGFFVLFFGIGFFGSSDISAQDDPTFKELIESVNSELKELKSRIQSISTKDLHATYLNDIERLEAEIKLLESDDKFKKLKDALEACKEEKELELRECKDDMAAQLKECNDSKEGLYNEHQEAEAEFQDKESDLNVRISTLNESVNSLTAEIQEGQDKFVSQHYNTPLLYTIDFLKNESNANSISIELDFYLTIDVSADINRDRPQVVKADLEIIRNVLTALKDKEIYYNKAISTNHITELDNVTSEALLKVKTDLIHLLSNDNCSNIRSELESEVKYILDENEELPKNFEILLLYYIGDNPIDIKDLHHNSWLVSQYDLLLETRKCGLDLQ